MRLIVFAFGSNLDLLQMQRRCPSVQYVDRAKLADHRLTFAGYSERWDGPVATIKPRARGVVHGVAYTITPGDLIALDRAEGVPVAYVRRTVGITLYSGARARAFTYELVRSANHEHEPSVEYAARVMAGYFFWRLPMDPLGRIIERLA